MIPNIHTMDATRAEANTIEELRDALRFYAREANYRSTTMYMSGQSGKTAIEIDAGSKARKALQETEQ